MSSGDKRTHVEPKRFMSLQALTDGFLSYLTKKGEDFYEALFPSPGIFDGAEAGDFTEVASNTYEIGGDTSALSFKDSSSPGGSPGLAFLDTPTALIEGTDLTFEFENELASDYQFGLKSSYFPSGVMRNVRTGAVNYQWEEEVLGDVASPSAGDITDIGGGQIEVIVDNACETGVDFSGREVTVCLIYPVSSELAVAFQTATVVYSGGINKVTIDYLGQASPELDGTAYIMVLSGVTVRKNYDIKTDPSDIGYVYLGEATGTGGALGAVDDTGQVRYDTSYGGLLAGFLAEHTLPSGKHTTINPDRVQWDTGDYLDYAANVQRLFIGGAVVHSQSAALGGRYEIGDSDFALAFQAGVSPALFFDESSGDQITGDRTAHAIAIVAETIPSAYFFKEGVEVPLGLVVGFFPGGAAGDKEVQVGDDKFKLKYSATVPALFFDTNDQFRYVRADNEFEFLPTGFGAMKIGYESLVGGYLLFDGLFGTGNEDSLSFDKGNDILTATIAGGFVQAWADGGTAIGDQSFVFFSDGTDPWISFDDAGGDDQIQYDRSGNEWVFWIDSVTALQVNQSRVLIPSGRVLNIEDQYCGFREVGTDMIFSWTDGALDEDAFFFSRTNHTLILTLDSTDQLFINNGAVSPGISKTTSLGTATFIWNALLALTPTAYGLVADDPALHLEITNAAADHGRFRIAHENTGDTAVAFQLLDDGGSPTPVDVMKFFRKSTYDIDYIEVNTNFLPSAAQLGIAQVGTTPRPFQYFIGHSLWLKEGEEPSVPLANWTIFTGVKDDTFTPGAGTGSAAMRGAGSRNNDAWVKIYIDSVAFWIPAWSDIDT